MMMAKELSIFMTYFYKCQLVTLYILPGVAHGLPGHGEDEERAGQLLLLRQELQEEEDEQGQVPGQVQRCLRSTGSGKAFSSKNLRVASTFLSFEPSWVKQIKLA